MAPLIPIAIGAKAASGTGQAVARAMTNDIAVYHTSYIKGKGKKKHVVDREIHVNPVSVGVGAAVVVGSVAAAALLTGIALFASGQMATREAGVTNTYTVIQTSDEGSASKYTVYNQSGVPVKRGVTWDAEHGDRILSDSQKAKGWHATEVKHVAQNPNKYQVTVTNDTKKKFAIRDRSHNSLISVGGGGLF
jgi:hypothetical protein